MRSSESPDATRASSSLSILGEYGQSMWLHWVSIWPQLHIQVILAPSCLALSELCPCSIPVLKTSAAPSATSVMKLRNLANFSMGVVNDRNDLFPSMRARAQEPLPAPSPSQRAEIVRVV